MDFKLCQANQSKIISGKMFFDKFEVVFLQINFSLKYLKVKFFVISKDLLLKWYLSDSKRRQRGLYSSEL